MTRKQSISSRDVVGVEGNQGITIVGGTFPQIQGVRYAEAPVDAGQDEDNDYGDIGNQLPAPRDLKMESQTVKFGPDGRQYVTVVVSFETDERAVGHEVRLAEA